MTDTRTSASAPWKWHCAAIAAICAAVLVGYWRALDAPFALDDNITRAYIRGVTSWRQILGGDSFGFFRPVKNLQFYLLLDAPVRVWHAVNLTMFVVAACGVYFLFRRFSGNPWGAMACALFWVLSPTCGTVAVWPSCLNILLAGAAMLFGVIAYDVARERGGWFRHGLWICLMILALCSYETAVAMAPLLVLADLYRKRTPWSRAAISCYAVAGILVIGLLAARHFAGVGNYRDSNPSFLTEMKGWQIAASAPYFLWTHLEMWVAPRDRLQVLGSYLWDQSIPKEILPFCWLLLAGTAGACVLFAKKAPLVSFGIAWFLIVSIPSGNFIPFRNTPYADYYVPLPSVGLCVALAAAVLAIGRKTRGAAVRPAVRVACVVGLLGVIAWRGAMVPVLVDWVAAWQSPLNILARTAVAKPYQYLAHSALAFQIAASSEKPEDSLIELMDWNAREAGKIQPDLAVLPLSLGQEAIWNGDTKAAEAYLKEGLALRFLSREEPLFAHIRLARIIRADPARKDEVWGHYLFLLRSVGGKRRVNYILEAADFLGSIGEKARQVETLERGLSRHPGDKDLTDALGRLRTGG